MSLRPRARLAMAVACALWLACAKSEPDSPDSGNTPDSGQPLPADAGAELDGGQDSDGGGGEPDAGAPEAWDGGYTALAEESDILDTGRYAACAVLTTNDAGTSIPCGSLEAFDVSACHRETLGQLSSAGLYGVIQRSDSTRPSFSFTGFALREDGGTQTVANQPLVTKQVDSDTFYVTGLLTQSDGGSTLYAYAGCEADSAQHFTGCYQVCINGGARSTRGTFDGVRLQRVAEPESSGISLVGEAPVRDFGTPVDVYVTKNHAYVVSQPQGVGAAQVGGLSVFDVSDKAHPALRKQVSLDGDIVWNAVWAQGDALYVGSLKHGVLVYDISNPDEPVLVRGVPGDSLDVHTLYVDGDRLYAMSYGSNQLLFFDVSAPLSPVLLNRYSVPSDALSFGSVHDAFPYQGRLYVNQMGQGYSVLDVAEVDAPQVLGSYVSEPLNNTSHANAVGTFAGRTIAFEGGEARAAHIRVLDVTDPAHIVRIGEIRLRNQTSVHNMVLRGTRLYVAWYAEGLRAFDVSNPTAPQQVAYYNTFRDSDPGRAPTLYTGAFGIRVPGDGYVYAVDSSRGLLVFREP